MTDHQKNHLVEVIGQTQDGGAAALKARQQHRDTEPDPVKETGKAVSDLLLTCIDDVDAPEGEQRVYNNLGYAIDQLTRARNAIAHYDE